mgnify:CR=1 FL=1
MNLTGFVGHALGLVWAQLKLTELARHAAKKKKRLAGCCMNESIDV